jgi:anti-sigma B factor antagonist
MKDVSYMDSSGVGELVSSFTSVSNRGGKLKLLNLSTKVHDLLQITQLLRVFEIFDNEKEAVNSF